MNDENYHSIAKRFGITGRVVFLIEGEPAAKFAYVIKEILEIYPVEQLGENLFLGLLDLQKRLEDLFKTYRQDYSDNPDEKERVRRYRKNLEQLFLLASELTQLLNEFEKTQPDHRRKIPGLIDSAKEFIEIVLNRFNLLQAEFPEK